MANFHNNRSGQNHHGNYNNHHNRSHNGGHNHHNTQNRDAHENRENRETRNNRENRDNQVINTFVLGTKELDDKTSEFQYDKGWYIITDTMGEEKNVIYKSKNAQEAYTKWNVYIGRKKERPQRAEKAE